MAVLILQHPVANDALLHLRNKKLPSRDFRREIQRVGSVLAVMATQHLRQGIFPVRTPLAKTTGPGLLFRQVLVPVTRAGNGLLEAFLPFLPDALVWHVNISRDEQTALPNFYGSKIPDQVPDDIDTYFVLDLMLATAGSASLTITKLKEAGAPRIIFIGLLAAQAGVDKLQLDHPDVDIILIAVDPVLNKKKFIVPGLGDAGDRQYPTV